MNTIKDVMDAAKAENCDPVIGESTERNTRFLSVTGTEVYVDPTKVIGVGRIYHETRRHIRDDWYYFHIFLEGGGSIKASGTDRAFVAKGRAKLLPGVNNEQL